MSGRWMSVLLVGFAFALLGASILFFSGGFPNPTEIFHHPPEYDPAKRQAYVELKNQFEDHRQDQRTFLEEIHRMDDLRNFMSDARELRWSRNRVAEAKNGYEQDDSPRNYASYNMSVEQDHTTQAWIAEEAQKVGVRDSTEAAKEIDRILHRMNVRAPAFFERERAYARLMYTWNRAFTQPSELPPGETQALPLHLNAYGEFEEGWNDDAIWKFDHFVERE